jgi:hypothetical protein
MLSNFFINFFIFFRKDFYRSVFGKTINNFCYYLKLIVVTGAYFFVYYYFSLKTTSILLVLIDPTISSNLNVNPLSLNDYLFKYKYYGLLFDPSILH